ncbi:MAG: phosphatidylinositol-specific phospholipase C domain-containing protein [Ruminococcaceae bacterium]|nr:phosphatidylinositol-specific phospholipase C domain-containing protein [Oscillospiraceae bacterium]
MQTNWMEKIDDNTIISDINLPGTHNSCAKKADFGFFSNCQSKTVYEQLCAGVRFLDIRVEKKGDALIAVHAIANCRSPENNEALRLDTVLDDCKKFLCENPSETILFSFKRDDGEGDEKTFDLFFNTFVNDRFWYTKNAFPNLGEVRSRLVLLSRCNHFDNDFYKSKDTGIDLTKWPYQEKFKGKIFEKFSISEYEKSEKTTCLVQDMYRLNPREKWEKAITPFLQNPPEAQGAIISFFSSTTGLFTPKITAKYINKRLKSSVLQRNKKYGWIIMDYPTETFINEIINSNFKIEEK